MSPQDNELMAKLIPNSKLVVCEKGSHCTMFDDPESYFPALKQFLFGIEGSV
jgi:proline iminopeptidase